MTRSHIPTAINNLIYHIRGKAVMLDSDLAALYQVQTGRLNEAVKRNLKRFPEDFMFQLTRVWKFDIAICGIKFPWRAPQVAPCLYGTGSNHVSCVLNSDIAIDVNIQIMRAFVQVRRLCMTIVDLKRKIDAMERKYDHQFKIVFDAIR